jgi:catechol 2,3-dioxygenase-like lactoylglutathione lyase family enzyme
MSLGDFPAHATLPVSDMERAKNWYREKLGLTPKEEDEGGAYYETGGSSFGLFTTPYAGTAKNTQMEWSVKDVGAIVAELKARGVTFEHFDMPGIEWDGDIAKMGPFLGCWFKDSEGNTLALTQPREG